ncbi:MAG: LacI family transcriptional regulator [Firmicutes bacterium]|nr:LacI family transcriptional regulator [Bacillota bacterium]
MRVTLSDVAREAGVSVVTVSRVINDTYPEKVSEKTRQRVLETVARMNYKPNVMARGLQKGRTFLIGVAIVRVADSFFGEILQGIHDAAAAADLGVLLGTRRLDIGKDESALRELQSRGVEGIVYYGTTQDPKTAKCLVAEGLPLIQLCNSHANLDAPYVVVDHFQGAYQGTEYLLKLGHRHIAHIGAYQDRDPQGLMRLAGYRAALKDHGIEVDESLVVLGGWTWESGYRAMHKLYRQCRGKVTAVFASSDYEAVGAMRACQEMGLRIPDDIALVGFDDLPFSAWLDIPLTTIAQPKEAMGQAAVRSLVDLIEGRSAPNVVFQPELVVRRSCGGKSPSQAPAVSNLLST